MELSNPFVVSLGISLAIQLFFFSFAMSLRTDKVTDLSYGLTFIILALYWLIWNEDGSGPLRLLVAAMVSLWGARLATYLLIRIIKTGKDDRFDDKRDDLIKFGKFWLLQGISVWAIMIPAIYVLSREAELESSVFTLIGGLIWLSGLVIETVADIQLYRFRFHKETKGKWIDEGLWHYSRHPNYFGEMLVWWGLFIAGVQVYQGLGWLSVIGPIFITLLLRYISGVPILEKKAEQRWGSDPDFKTYKESTNLLVLGPKR